MPSAVPAATLLLSDDFEAGTLNKWPSPGNAVNFNAGIGAAHSGSRVARGCYGDDYLINLRSYDVAYPEVYLKYYIKYESGFNWGNSFNDNNKHARLRTAATINGFFFTLFKPAGTRVWYTDGNTINSGANIADQQGSDFTPQTNRWYKYEFYWKLNTGGSANGQGWVKVDGATMMSFSGIQYRTGDNVFYDELVFPGNNGGRTSPGQDCVQIDDVEIWNGPPPTTPSPSAPANLKVK
jgi:hypothetical protein